MVTEPSLPQSTLDGIRGAVDAVARGAVRIPKLAGKLGFSARHAEYAVDAAHTLGLIEVSQDGLLLSGIGRRLSQTQRGSEEEALILSDCVASNALLAEVAPGLIGSNPPDKAEIAERMLAHATLRGSRLSKSTALHRAAMLLKWREVLINRRMEFSRPKRSQRTEAALSIGVRNFAQIKEANIEFGDLTVLVGPQATGKSLVLQWFKAAVDIAEIFPALKEAGSDVESQGNLLDLIFGEGMSTGWRSDSSVTLNSKHVSLATWTKKLKRRARGKVFYIPGHRAMLLADGWPAPFVKLNADTPVVARLFSQDLYQRFSGRQAAALFPVSRILKEQYRDKIDDAIFHGGKVELEKKGLRYQLTLSYQKAQHLPFMTWTAGQREFTPLLLGLYHVLPPRKSKKLKDVDWIVIEEPEMGLHPQAISVFMLLVLDLLWRGYRVVVSTHSPLVLDVVWAIRQMRERNARWQLLSDAFGISEGSSLKTVMKHALSCDYRVFFMQHGDDGLVRSSDISELDPNSPDSNEADWGGLTGFSSRFADAVRAATNESDSD